MPGVKRKRRQEPKTLQDSKKVKSDDGAVKSLKAYSLSQSEHDTKVYSYWLIKSEPESRFEKGIDVKFGLEDLKKEPDQTACWDGVRNYQARNHMMAMKSGQKVLFYHSNCKGPRQSWSFVLLVFFRIHLPSPAH